jgi:hypothetical protein
MEPLDKRPLWEDGAPARAGAGHEPTRDVAMPFRRRRRLRIPWTLLFWVTTLVLLAIIATELLRRR